MSNNVERKASFISLISSQSIQTTFADHSPSAPCGRSRMIFTFSCCLTNLFSHQSELQRVIFPLHSSPTTEKHRITQPYKGYKRKRFRKSRLIIFIQNSGQTPGNAWRTIINNGWSGMGKKT